jgi:hypothetical protein
MRLEYRLRRWGAMILVTALAACSAPDRDPLHVEAIAGGAEAFDEELRAFQARALERVIRRADLVVGGAADDDTVDVLALSGGADWGAFGAGYLSRWSELGDAAVESMPEFDIIAGISTGALIGTYVASGEPARYRGIEEFYRQTQADWVRFAGIVGFLPSSIAVFNNDAIRSEVAAAVDEPLIADLRQAHTAGRTVAVGTTDLDLGTLRYWELGAEATAREDPHARIVDILMAATAIPGAFPPVEIDGRLHADGGAVQGVPGISPPQLPAFTRLWRERYGNRPMPLFRFWFIFNNQLDLQPEPVGLSWFAVVYRSYQTISQTAFKAPLATHLLQAEAGSADLPAMEVRWVAIPDSYVPSPDAVPFDPAVTNELADLGREVAERPGGGWRSDYPG